MARFTKENPEVLTRYKEFYRSLEGARGALKLEEFQEDFDESEFSDLLISELKKIPSGGDDADRYHRFIIGTLEFIFWPNLIYPVKEHQIHEGRKRIDISYTNAAQSGFFHRAHSAHNIMSNFIAVECKNYSKDPANPEIDQLSGRFSTRRGKLGLLLYRDVSDYKLLCQRCADTAKDDRGIIMPLGDDQISEFLEYVRSGKRHQIDGSLETLFRQVVS